MNQYNPTISHQFYNQFIEEYVKEEEMVYKINTDNGIETGYDEDNKLLFKLIPNCFKSKNFQSNDLYKLLIKDIDENESKIYNTNNSSHIESYINNISNLLAEYSPNHYNKNQD
jgi:hypothetical protein